MRSRRAVKHRRWGRRFRLPRFRFRNWQAQPPAPPRPPRTSGDFQSQPQPAGFRPDRFSFQLPGLIPSPFRRIASSRYLLCVPATLRSIGGGAGGFACQGFDFAIGRRSRLPHQDRRALQATFSRNPNLPALSRQSFSAQLPGLIPSPFRRTASSRYLLCVPATLRSIGGGAGGFPCQGFDFAIGRRNRLPHQDRRVLQATFSRNPNLPALSRQSFSSAMRLRRKRRTVEISSNRVLGWARQVFGLLCLASAG